MNSQTDKSVEIDKESPSISTTVVDTLDMGKVPLVGFLDFGPSYWHEIHMLCSVPCDDCTFFFKPTWEPMLVPKRTPGIRRLRGFMRKLVNLGLRYTGSKERIVRAFEEFSANSLSWVLENLAGRREDIRRVQSLVSEVLTPSALEKCEEDSRFKPLLKYILTNSSSTRRSVENHRKFSGLVFLLAATFNGPVDWLEDDRSKRSLVLLSVVYEALRSGVIALRNNSISDSSDFRFKKDTEFRDRILESQLMEYGITVKRTSLGSLEGCLIRSDWGSSVCINNNLPANRKEWVCLHELGHFLLNHRANSEYGLDPSLIESNDTRDIFVKQEYEADCFAELRQHVLNGIMEHCKPSREFANNLQPQPVEKPIKFAPPIHA